MSSSFISKKLFEKAEFVSSNDPDVDHDNLVFMDSDSESSEKFNYDLHLQQTSLQEVVREDAGEGDVAICITDNHTHFHVKQEEECIIEDVPYEIDDDESKEEIEESNDLNFASTLLTIEPLKDIKQDEEAEEEINFGATTSFGGNSEFCITRISPCISPHLKMSEPTQDCSELDEEQFELIHDPISEPVKSGVSTPAKDVPSESLEEPKKSDEEKKEVAQSVEECKDEVAPFVINSLQDHQYSQPDTTNREFCDDLVQDLLIETGNFGNPAIVPLLEKFTELFSHFVEDDQSSQMSLYVRSMSKTLAGFKKRLTHEQTSFTAPKPPPVSELKKEPEEEQKLQTEESASVGLTQLSEFRWQEQEKGHSSLDLQETQSSEDEAVICHEVNKVEVSEERKLLPENENVTKLKDEINKVNDFAKKVSGTATELMQLPMHNDELLADVKMKFLTLAENSLKENEKLFEDIKSQFSDKTEMQKTEEKSKMKMLKKLLDLSDSMSSSDSDNDQILNLNRKIQKNGPQTPAIVSSTKEDTEMSEMEEKPVVTSRASTEESGTDKEKNHEKEVDRLLDLAALNFAKPASSKKVSKKKLLKKRKIRSSEIDSILDSSDDENYESDRSSSIEERDTSDEEQQMLLRQNADVKNDWLAGSESSEGSDDDGSEFEFTSSDEEDEEQAEKKTKKDEKEKKDEVKDEKENLRENLSDSEGKKSTSAVVETTSTVSNVIQSPTKLAEEVPNKVEAVSLVSDDEDGEQQTQIERSRPVKKTVKLSSAEREIFSKDFMEINGNSKKEASTNKTSNTGTNGPSKLKTELSPSKPLNPHGTIDVSMFENRRAAKEFDLEKMIEKRHFPNEPSTSSSHSAQTHTKPSLITMNDDECISLSSDSDSEISAPTRFPKRKKMLTEEELQEETKKANKDEEQRVKRLEKKTKALTQLMSQRMSQNGESQGDIEDELILDYDPKKNITIVVHPKLVKKLKDHQKEGIKFMYDTCYGSIADEVKTESGCILAHCMGLGKTLQLITLLHTLIMHPDQLKTSRVIIICPKSTITNWYEEFKKWIIAEGIPSENMGISFLEDFMKFSDRVQRLENVFNENRPMVTLINYEAFRNLVLYSDSKRAKNADQKEVKRMQDIIDKCLLTGPDLVVCDEGHLIKNQTGATNRAITKIVTRRRIILTGTPVQNNLNEYYSMVDFIKPALLGTVKEFNNLYGTPIKDGQHIDSDKAMIKKMKQRSFILNKKLSKFVQRKEASVLREYLPEKHEYCIFVPLTKVQEDLYEMFLRQNPLNGGHKLLNDYTALRKIWTHPKVLQNAYDRAWKGELINEAKRRARDDVDNDQAPEDIYDSFDGNFGVKSKWWKDLVSEDDLESLLSSNKFMLLFEILRQCQERNEKVLVFSAFVAVLNVVEEFMQKIHNQRYNPNAAKYGYNRFERTWIEGLDYYRLDGSTKRDARQQMIERFNNRNNTRMCCFLISARAGGQGINLTGANRCVILDTSWNPAADQQNIFRIYRLGQDKVCYVYRLIALGTMEEKVYSRSITKQAMSGRVVDKQQIDRHYSMDELQQLYILQKFDPSKKQTQPMPADEILQYLLFHCSLQAFKYHDHDSLLENKPEQDLNEDEINEAWQVYEQESKGPIARAMPGIGNGNLPLYSDMMGPQLVNFNNYLIGSPYAYPQSPYYNPQDYLQSIFNIGNGGFLNNIVPSTPLASSSIPSTSSVTISPSTSLLQNQFNNLNKVAINGKAGSSTQNTPKRRQSTSKAKAERQAMIKQFQDESLNRVDVATSRKNSLENVSILPDDDSLASRSFSAQHKSISNSANKGLNESKKSKALDVIRNNVPAPSRKNPAVMQGMPTVSAVRLPQATGIVDRYQRLQSVSPSTSTTSSNKVQPRSSPSPALTRVINNTTSQELRNKIELEMDKLKNKVSQSSPGSKANYIYQSPKPQMSTESLLQRSASNNAMNITPKTKSVTNANLSQRTQSHSLIDLTKNQGTAKARFVDLPQVSHPNLVTKIPAQALTKSPLVDTSYLSSSKNRGPLKPLRTASSQVVQPVSASKNIVKEPPLNLSQRANSQTSLNSKSSKSSATSSAGVSTVTSVTGQSKKIVMSPMMLQSARTSAAAPVNVKHAQVNAIKQPQPQWVQVPKTIPKAIRVSKVQSLNPALSTAPRIATEASQNTIPQRDPKVSGMSNGNLVKTVVDPHKKNKVPTHTKVFVGGNKNKDLTAFSTKSKQPVTFNNALSNARSLQLGGTQDVSVLKISKTTPTSNSQQPSTSVIRTAPQKRQGETLISPAPKRPNPGARPLKITSRNEPTSIQDSVSIIEDIVEIE